MPRSQTARWRFILAALLCIFGIAAVADHYWVSYRVDRDLLQLRTIVASLAQTDPAYASLTVARSTHPKAWIFGTLNSAQLDRLQQQMVKSFDKEEAHRIVSQIKRSLPATNP